MICHHCAVAADRGDAEHTGCPDYDSDSDYRSCDCQHKPREVLIDDPAGP